MTNRVKSFKKNFRHDIIAHILTNVLEFVNRIFFLKLLGEELLGLNSLFISFLSLLSIAELGLGNVFNVYLYKPIHENDHNKIAAANNYFKKAYKIIIAVIIVLGIAMIPFILIFTKTTINPINIVLFYSLYFLSVIITYFTMTDITILSTDQKHYVVSKYTSYTLIAQNVFQFIVVYFFRSYVLYLIIAIIIKLIYNFLIKNYIKKNYKYLENTNEILNKGETKGLISNIKDMIVYKLSCVVISATDNILISAIISVSAVGIYSIYNLLSNALSGLFGVASTSVVASVGNIVVSENKDVRYSTFDKLKFVYLILTGLCSVGLYVGATDFITLFFGNKYTFNNIVLVIIIINFIILQITRPVLLYKECAGLFKEIKYVNLICAILNIIFSLIFGLLFGIVGILASTVISRLLTTFWYEAKILYDKVFEKKYISFIFDFIKLLIVITLSLIVPCIISKYFTNISLMNFIIKEFIACMNYFIIAVLFYYRDENFKFYYNEFKLKINKRKLDGGVEIENN